MGYEILVVFSCVVLLPFVVVGFIAYWAMTNHERARLEDTWEHYAAKRDREYVPARGEWPNRTSPAVQWRSAGLDFRLEVIGLEAGARTRLIAWPHGRLLGHFVVGSRPRCAGGSGGIDDAFFAEAFGVVERPSGVAARVLDGPGRRALLGFWQHEDVELRYRRGRLMLEWPGRESNDARIDEAERVLRELARGVEKAFLGAIQSLPRKTGTSATT